MRFVRANVRALMTRKSCAVGMRNALLRNYLKPFIGIPIQILIKFVGHAHSELGVPVVIINTAGCLKNTQFSQN